MKVLMGCWRDVLAMIAVPVLIEVGVELWDQDGYVWGNAGRDALVWVAISAVWAALAWRSLRRRARTAGVALTPDALADRQTRQLRVLRPSVGWSDRMRTELKTSDRASVTAEKGREEIWFHWRPGRRRLTVWGSIAFDENAGTVLVDLREEEVRLGVSGMRRGASFAALCQLAGGLGLVGVEGPGRAGDQV